MGAPFTRRTSLGEVSYLGAWYDPSTWGSEEQEQQQTQPAQTCAVGNQLSQNFSVAELSVTNESYANIAPCEVRKAMKALVQNVLQPVRDHFGMVKVNSGYRSPEVNAAVGGVSNSDHLTGSAADIEVPGTDNLLVAKWIRDNLPFRQLILEYYDPMKGGNSGWIHVSYSLTRPNKREVLTKRLTRYGGDYVTGLSPMPAPVEVAKKAFPWFAVGTVLAVGGWFYSQRHKS